MYAHWNAKDPMRKEAYRLSKLSSIYAWRGKLVDHVISSTVIPAVRMKQKIGLNDVVLTAQRFFDAQRNGQVIENAGEGEKLKFGGFFEYEYGQTLTNEMFEKAWQEIQTSLTGLWKHSTLKEALKSADWLIAQPKLSFPHNGVTVRTNPDVLALHNGKPPVIIDWKVNWNPQRDHWLQLATYAVAVTKSKHGQNFKPGQLRLLEAQLLTGELREHTVTEEDEQHVYDLITETSTSMLMAIGDAKGLDPSDFLPAKYTGICERCSFRKLCWEMIS
jgi:CRISPR/Cas system-associated exonuclease Cas4 (RecB family)